MGKSQFSGSLFLSTGILILLAGGMILLSGCGGASGEQEADNPLDRGRLVFQEHCVSCHGTSAKGDGPVAAYMTVKPTDLTRLTQENGGAFPIERVRASIDGRDSTRAHGTRAMPVWGNIWEEEGGKLRDQNDVQQRIDEVAEYIRTLQYGEATQTDTTAVREDTTQ